MAESTGIRAGFATDPAIEDPDKAATTSEGGW
jgi:hypothetical protein